MLNSSSSPAEEECFAVTHCKKALEESYVPYCAADEDSSSKIKCNKVIYTVAY